MFENLEMTENRYEEVSMKLSDPTVANDQEQFKKLMKEYKTLTPIIEKYRVYKKAEKTADEAKEMLEATLDRDFKDMVEDELKTARACMEEVSKEITLMLLPRDPNDDKNVIFEIRGGAGGEEAALFAANLYRMYSMYADSKGWKTEVLNINETEIGGIKEISFMIEGDAAYSRLKFESGVHRVQRVPETEASGRIHTSTVTVAVLPEAEEVEVDINTDDLKIDTYRSSGAGGQHINKTESAIRITHIPSGIVVECQEERSQYKNRDKAMTHLRSRLLARKQSEQAEQIAADRRSQVGTGDRSERIRTYNYPQGRVTDHRIGLTLYKLDDILNGNIEEIIDALNNADQSEKLNAGTSQ
jgi:peptide chain release factor 1